jgi:hypothetical protein
LKLLVKEDGPLKNDTTNLELLSMFETPGLLAVTGGSKDEPLTKEEIKKAKK